MAVLDRFRCLLSGAFAQHIALIFRNEISLWETENNSISLWLFFHSLCTIFGPVYGPSRTLTKCPEKIAISWGPPQENFANPILIRRQFSASALIDSALLKDLNLLSSRGPNPIDISVAHTSWSRHVQFCL